MAELTVISWRDIPAQVVAREGRDRAAAQLSDRFQEAIDLAATRIGLIGTDEYLSEWRRESRPCGADLRAETEREAARLEAVFPDERLMALARAGGVSDLAPLEGATDRDEPPQSAPSSEVGTE